MVSRPVRLQPRELPCRNSASLIQGRQLDARKTLDAAACPFQTAYEAVRSSVLSSIRVIAHHFERIDHPSSARNLAAEAQYSEALPGISDDSL